MTTAEPPFVVLVVIRHGVQERSGQAPARRPDH
jgi:hypothetical protein